MLLFGGGGKERGYGEEGGLFELGSCMSAMFRIYSEIFVIGLG